MLSRRSAGVLAIVLAAASSGPSAPATARQANPPKGQSAKPPAGQPTPK